MALKPGTLMSGVACEQCGSNDSLLVVDGPMGHWGAMSGVTKPESRFKLEPPLRVRVAAPRF